MKLRIFSLVLLSLILALLLVFAVFGETIIDLLTPVKNDWDIKKDGTTYYMDENSDPVTGWFTLGGYTYYLDPARDGAMHTGWLELSEGTYYLNESGARVTGWQTIDAATHYFDENGILGSGWLTQAEGTYYLSENGTATTGWLALDGQQYYLDTNGLLRSGWLELENGRYYLDESGARVTGWLEFEEGRYYLNENGIMQTGWLELEEGTFFFNDDGTQFVGWLETGDGLRYMSADGSAPTGWLETEQGLCYLNEDGTMYTGWLELDGQKYYLKEDGTAAKGRLVIDEKTYFFTSTGASIIMVNTWNKVPEDYEVELTSLSNGKRVAVDCYDALMQMLTDCEAAGCHPQVIGGYRTVSDQRALMSNKVAQYQEQGYGYSAAYAKALLQVALPGCSEHHLGLAVDILDKYYPKSETGNDNCLVWLGEHCWEYGFIVRYPNEKTNITGIKYEPWHYRYVGIELAMELKDSGLCLEEYLDQLTNDGTTCGNPDA